MKIESLKKSKIFYTIIITLVILCSLVYYFGYYRNLPQYADKNSPEYAANIFFSKIKNSTPGERNEEEIYQMIYYEKSLSMGSNIIDFEEMVKVYYKNLVLNKYELKSKTKIDDDLYEFTALTEPKIISVTNINREDNILKFFMIRINGEWKLAWGVHELPDSKLKEHEILYKRLIALREDAERNHTDLY